MNAKKTLIVVLSLIFVAIVITVIRVSINYETDSTIETFREKLTELDLTTIKKESSQCVVDQLKETLKGDRSQGKVLRRYDLIEAERYCLERLEIDKSIKVLSD